MLFGSFSPTSDTVFGMVGSLSLLTTNDTTSITAVRTANGSITWLIVISSLAIPPNTTYVRNNGAIVVPIELAEPPIFWRCTPEVPFTAQLTR